MTSSQLIQIRSENSETYQNLRNECQNMIQQTNLSHIDNILEQHRQDFTMQLQNIEKQYYTYKDELAYFKTDIIEDIEQLKAKTNSITLKYDKELTKIVPRQEIKSIFDNQISDHLQEYVRSKDLKSFRNEFEQYKEDIIKQHNDFRFDADQMQEQLYGKLIRTINKEYDLKFENVYDTIKISSRDGLKELTETLNSSEERLRKNSDDVRGNSAKISDLQVLVNSISEKVSKIDYGSLSKLDTQVQSKFMSNEKYYKSKDFEIEEGNDRSYQTFKVSPVKSANEKSGSDYDGDGKMKEIEDSSMFGLTPTPKPVVKGKSITDKALAQKAKLNATENSNLSFDKENNHANENSPIVTKDEYIEQSAHSQVSRKKLESSIDKESKHYDKDISSPFKNSQESPKLSNHSYISHHSAISKKSSSI